MVFIVDEGSEFGAPLEKVWKLSEAHTKDAAKIHPGGKNYKTETVSENATIQSWESDMQGQTVKTKIKVTRFHPLGIAIELLEGAIAGSKFFNYYIPNGNKTGVTVVGDFKSSMMPDENQLKQAVMSFLEQAFNEDSAYLKIMS
jgi:hypothetical protein